jgi:uncharacterized protein
MFGIRILLYLVGIALVIWILVRLARAPRVAERPQKRVGSMVRCARCGVHVPENEALRSGNKHYCSSAHRDEDQ